MEKKRVLLKISFFLIIVTFLSLTIGCGKIDKEGPVLASIGNSKITAGSVNKRISNLPVHYQRIIRRRKKEFLEELINDTLLYQEAVNKGLHKDADVQEVIEEARKKILIARLLKEEVEDKINITEEDVVVFYGENKSDYMTPEIMRVSHILVQSPEAADSILGRLDKGENFEDLAKAKSVDPTAQRGGDIGYFPRGQLMTEFENACVRLDVGETSGVVKTKLGYHIIKLTDRRVPQQKPVEDVSEDISLRLRTIKKQRLFNELLERLHKETDIVINEEALDELEDLPGKGKKEEG
jgi:peptidyl-prolyl cis-trans isomerase C